VRGKGANIDRINNFKKVTGRSLPTQPGEGALIKTKIPHLGGI